MITISNDGQEIDVTNFWDSDFARAGLVFLSFNAGAARLLVPDRLRPCLREMKTAKHVIVSRGNWTEMGYREALELLFEDHSSSPFALHIDTRQTDRVLPDSDHGIRFLFAVWTRQGKRFELPAMYRIVQTLPCLEPWKAVA